MLQASYPGVANKLERVAQAGPEARNIFIDADCSKASRWRCLGDALPHSALIVQLPPHLHTSSPTRCSTCLTDLHVGGVDSGNRAV